MTEENYEIKLDNNPEISKQSEKYYDINMAIIEKKHLHVYKKIKDYEDSTYISKVEGIFDAVYLAHNENGEIQNVVIEKSGNNYLLCDHKDPYDQAKKWMETTIDDNNNIELLYGCGLGYHIEAIIDKYPSKRLIIIEPSIELFLYLINTRDMSKILNKCWLLVEEEFDQFLKNFLQLYWDAKNKGVFKLQIINVYNLIFDKVWIEFRDKFKEQMNALTVDTTTRKILTKLWLNNYTKNIYKMKDASNCDGFLGKFKNVPGILVSAGSSLEGNVHLLNNIKDKCLIVSASSARLSMKQFDVSPHMFVTVDASDGETRIVDGIENDNEYMVYSNQLCPESLNIYNGKKIFINYNSDFYTVNFLNWAGIQSGHIMSAPSVANTCYDYLYKLGCNPIIFIGQDLSFTKNKQYAGDIDYGLDMEEQEFIDNGYIQVKDIYGDKVFTMPPFLAMRNCFEDQIRMTKMLNPDLDVINCTEGGLNIQGVRNEKLEDIIKEFSEQEISVIDLIEELYQNSMFEDYTEKIEQFNKMLFDELQGLKEMIQQQYVKLKEVEKFKINKNNHKEFDALLTETDLMSHTRESLMIYKLLLSPLLQVDLYQMGIKFVQENEKEKDFKKKRKAYLNTLREQIGLIESKIEYVEGLLNDKDTEISSEESDIE